MRRALPWFVVPLLAGCGRPEEQAAPPPLPFNKVAPTLPRLYRGRGLDQWLELAVSPDAARRAEAPWALVELSSDPKQVGPLLERLLDDPDASVRYAAVVGVGRAPVDLGPNVSRRVAALLGAPEPGLALAVRDTLKGLGARVVPALLERLGGEDALARLVLRTLGEIGPDAAPAAEALVRLHASSEALRGQAAWALEHLEAGALPALASAVPGAPDDEAVSLLGLLARQGALLAPHATTLAEALVRPPAVRQAARDALLAAGSAVLPELDRLARDGSPALQAEAASLAGEIRAAAPR